MFVDELSANKGGPGYNKKVEKKVRIFNNFDEADRAEALADVRLTPRERLRIVEELRAQTHPDACKQGLARVCRVTELASS